MVLGHVVTREREIRAAAHRIGGSRTRRRPRRHEIEVRRKGPRVRGREQVILQAERSCVRPVVRDLSRGVIPEDVGLTPGAWTRPPARLPRVHLAGGGDRLERPDRSLHRPTVDGDPRCRLIVRSTLVVHVRVVIRPLTGTGRVGDAHADVAVPPRETVGAGERAEVVIERAVLLHDEDQVVQVLDPRLRVDVMPVARRGRDRKGGGQGDAQQGAAASRNPPTRRRRTGVMLDSSRAHV